jgi:AraC-like DNA-binding protein
LRHVVAHFREPLRLTDIASASGISPRHLTRTFARCTGQSVNGYITNLRLAYAKRLLAVEDAKILDVIHASGFSCAAQFYHLFRAQTGVTPRQYRLAAAGASRATAAVSGEPGAAQP